MKSDTIAAAARRWDAARIEALRLRNARSALVCPNEAPSEPDVGWDGTPPCWNDWQSIDGGREKGLPDRDEWCPNCVKRQEIHAAYRAAMKRRGVAMRQMQALLAAERKRLGFNEDYTKKSEAPSGAGGEGT